MLDAAEGDEGDEDFLDVGDAGAGEGLGEGFCRDGGAGGSECFFDCADAFGDLVFAVFSFVSFRPDWVAEDPLGF